MTEDKIVPTYVNMNLTIDTGVAKYLRDVLEDLASGIGPTEYGAHVTSLAEQISLKLKSMGFE